MSSEKTRGCCSQNCSADVGIQYTMSRSKSFINSGELGIEPVFDCQERLIEFIKKPVHGEMLLQP